MDASIVFENHDGKLPSELYSVCELCDDGGDVLSCEGKCKRSFHPTLETGIGAYCEAIGFKNAAEYHGLPAFVCENCKHAMHQCYACGKLGSSDTTSGGEVFQCASQDCGYFYHPQCAAIALFPADEDMTDDMVTRIALGFPFLCPRHRCHICQDVENKDELEMQFAICRRCPKVYHRKCLPTTIGFIASADGSSPQRAWDGLLENRILMFCMSHDMVPVLETPLRDHILFPWIDETMVNERGGHPIMKEVRSWCLGTLDSPMSFPYEPVYEGKENTTEEHNIVKHEPILGCVKDEPVDPELHGICAPLKSATNKGYIHDRKCISHSNSGPSNWAA